MNKPPDFLVIGLKKAGTYWLSALLDAHPEVSCFPALDHAAGVKEGDFFNMIAKWESDKEGLRKALLKKHSGFFRDLTPLTETLSQEEFFGRAREYYNEFCGIWRTKKLVGEKTPTYVSYLGLIDRLYPNIKKICILRDHKDRLTSFHFYRLNRARMLNRAEPVLDERAVRDYVKIFKKEYQALLDYRGSLHCVTYNSLMNNPRGTLFRLLNYLGVSASEGILEFLLKESDFKKRKRFSVFLGTRTLKIRRFISRFTKKIANPKNAAKAGFKAANFWYHLEWRLFKTLFALGFSRVEFKEEKPGYFREGGRGDWQNHLNQNQADYIDRELKELEKKVFDKYKLTYYV